MSQKLRDIFTPTFAYALLYCRNPNEQDLTYSELRETFIKLFQDQATASRKLDIPIGDYRDAQFAVVAWLDESIVRCAAQSNPEVAQQWKRSSLQVEIFQTANAGEEFFERLDALDKSKNAVREVYHMCLALGFRGRYYAPTDSQRLKELQRKAAHNLPTETVDLLDLDKRQEKITPQPYEARDLPTFKPPASRSNLWVPLALGAAVALAVWWLISPGAGRTRIEVIEDAKGRLRVFTCCALEVKAFDENLQTLNLAGRFESPSQREQIHQALLTIPEVNVVRDDNFIVPRPFCEVLETLGPIDIAQLQGDPTNRVDVTVAPQRGCGDIRYMEGEPLEIKVSSSAQLGHLQVDYFVARGDDVVHLYPQDGSPAESLANPTLDISGWRVEPPFGLELITVIRGPEPIFEHPLPSQAEGVNGYLRKLKEVVTKIQGSKEYSAAHCLIKTDR